MNDLLWHSAQHRPAQKPPMGKTLERRMQCQPSDPPESREKRRSFLAGDLCALPASAVPPGVSFWLRLPRRFASHEAAGKFARSWTAPASRTRRRFRAGEQLPNFDNFQRVPKAVSPLRSATAVQSERFSRLRPLFLHHSDCLLECGQFLFPLGGLGGLPEAS